jgi:hypothetical protein
MTLPTYRLLDLKLPLDHAPEDLRAEVLSHLRLTDEQVTNIHVHRRGYDARSKSNIHFIIGCSSNQVRSAVPGRRHCSMRTL